MAVKTEVNIAIEADRRAGVIGGALEAEVTLYCSGPLETQLKQLDDELRFALMTSYATVKSMKEPVSDGMHLTNIDGLQIGLHKTTYTKCVRCWNHREDVGAHVQHPELCGRCVVNVDGSGEVRHYV